MLAMEWGWILLGREKGRGRCVKWGEEMKSEELNLMQVNFELMIKYWFTEREKKKKVVVGGENLMPM